MRLYARGPAAPRLLPNGLDRLTSSAAHKSDLPLIPRMRNDRPDRAGSKRIKSAGAGRQFASTARGIAKGIAASASSRCSQDAKGYLLNATNAMHEPDPIAGSACVEPSENWCCGRRGSS
jgi:hypothetical protein